MHYCVSSYKMDFLWLMLQFHMLFFPAFTSLLPAYGWKERGLKVLYLWL